MPEMPNKNLSKYFINTYILDDLHGEAEGKKAAPPPNENEELIRLKSIIKQLEKYERESIHWKPIYDSCTKYMKANKIEGKLEKSTQCFEQFLRLLEFAPTPPDDALCD
jgi:hypothetical protein